MPRAQGRHDRARARRREVRALAAKASCGVSDERGRLSEALKRMKGSDEQLAAMFCDRNGVSTLDAGALLAH